MIRKQKYISTKRIGLYVLMLNLLLSCGDNNTQTEVLIKSFDNPTNTIEATELSTIFSSYRFIKLETREDILVGRIMQVIKNNDLLFIRTANQELFVFGTNGEFHKKIGLRGRGPEEYNSFSTYAVNPEGTTVVIYGSKSLYFYEVETGKFIKKVDLAILVSSIKYLSDNDLLVQVVREGYVVAKIDSNGQIRNTYGSPTRVFELALPFPFTQLDESKFMFKLGVTSNYHIYNNKTNTFSNGLITNDEQTLHFEALSNKLDQTGMDGYVEIIDYLKDYYNILQIKITKDWIHTFHNYNDNGYLSIYDKKARELTRCIITSTSEDVTVDNILYIDPKYYGSSTMSDTDDNTIITWIEPFDLLSKFPYKDLPTQSFKTNYQKALELYNTVKPEENPIIIEFTL
jgi:hypothetical protein